MELCLIICIILGLILSHLNDRGLGVPFEFWKIPVPNWMLLWIIFASLSWRKRKHYNIHPVKLYIWPVCILDTWYNHTIENSILKPKLIDTLVCCIKPSDLFEYLICSQLHVMKSFLTFQFLLNSIKIFRKRNYAFLTSTHSLQSRNILPNISPIWILHYQVDARQKS